MASSRQLFSLDRVKKDHIALMGHNLNSNINLEKLSKNHTAHKTYLPIQAEIMIPHTGHYKLGHLDWGGWRRKEYLN